MSTKQSSPVMGIIIAAIMIVGGWFAYQHLTKPMADEAEASNSWPKTEGVIIHSSIEKNRSSKGKATYSADIRYEFYVNDTLFEGSRVSFGNVSTSDSEDAKKKLRKYPLQKKVDVYYDPEFPGESVLIKGGNMWTNIIKYGPLLFVFFGALLALQSLKRILRFFLGGR
jgi:hypothetical protein